MPSLSRRELLAACGAGAVGALAGCADPDVAMFVESVPTDSAIAERATLPPDRYDQSLVADAVDGGADYPSETGDDPPFEPDRPILHDRAVYTLSWTETDRQETRTEYVLEVTVHDDGRDVDVEFEDLPAIDRERLAHARRAAERAAEENRDPPTVEFQHHYTDAEQERSALVPEPQYDVIGLAGQPATVGVTETTVTLDVFRYTARERAPTAAAFGETLRSRHRFSLGGLSEAEREFFESVHSEGSYYQGAFDDDQAEAFEGVADRLVAEPALFVDHSEGEWLVEHDGGSYWVRVDFVSMPEYAEELEPVEEL